ncbi:hypothetical protein [Actinocorallia sp. A-T 12471]|uniref:hypothetical protein n=1 Tax=Actinocorallia sp. A-T 12471 TaxID=3089813 RepID=UPI0029CF067F|nr:hypothetical protein [Actinocorallia sp. A-T 12471]MDX6739056.1 hypothetical protein [Actinocorallia sp. A-T 12471]
MPAPDEDLGKALAGALAKTAEGRALIVVSVTGERISVWKVKRDDMGIPRARRASFSPDSLTESGERYGPATVNSALARVGVAETDAVLVVAAPDLAFAEVGGRRVIVSAAPVRDALGTAIADEPLTQMYELVTLRATVGGRLELGAVPLFPMGTQRGATARVPVRFTAREEDGTVLAVVASTPWERVFRPVSVLRAHTAPAARDLRVDLAGPGRVGFPDVPGTVVPEARPWAELVDALPGRRAPRPEGTTRHLVCAVETGSPGTTRQTMSERVAMLRSLVQTCPVGTRISLVGYGPHTFPRAGDGSAPEVLCWAEPVPVFLDRLAELERRPVATEGYPLAARLECAFALVAAQLAARASDTALLVVGARPPFPPRVHPSQILPCPRRHDWSSLAAALRGRGVRIAAVRDGREAPGFWRELAPGALFDAAARDQEGVAAALRLAGRGEQYAFPLSETG